MSANFFAITASVVFCCLIMVGLRRRDKLLSTRAALRQLAVDQAQKRDLTQQLHESAARFQSLIELSADWYWEQDSLYRFVAFEGKSAAEYGIASEDQIGKTPWELGASNMTDADWSIHRVVLQARLTFHDLELCRTNRDGEMYWASVCGRPIIDANGACKGYRGIGHIITERKRAGEETQRQAFYDTLTGLPNRRYLLEKLQQSVAASQRTKLHSALLFIDLDKFKNINDTLGHLMGDKLLQLVAQRLCSKVRGSDTVARMGGDEFVVILDHLSVERAEAAQQAQTVAANMLHVLNEPYPLDSKMHHCTLSIGMTLFGHSNAESAEEMLHRADTAMYQAKAAGRNTMRFL
jgi:diguanylate cyclase (GGDEF)-like protein/PAS domain S-box-containing protein